MDVDTLVIETAFRDDERAVALVSKHLHPAQLQHELAQLRRATDVYITHIKPGEVEAVMAEIAAQPTPHRIRVLEHGQRFTLR
jgi:ribonuclease BN (tRNA processing enzyme)